MTKTMLYVSWLAMLAAGFFAGWEAGRLHQHRQHPVIGGMVFPSHLYTVPPPQNPFPIDEIPDPVPTPAPPTQGKKP